MTEPIGPLPISPALSEASPESLSELMSRDPRGWSRQDRDKIIERLRAQRGRFLESEAKPKSKKPALPQSTNVTSDDFF